jgi:hypothetical protein
MPLVTRARMALEIARCELTNRVTTPLTSAGNAADAPEPILNPSPATGYDADMLEV